MKRHLYPDNPTVITSYSIHYTKLYDEIPWIAARYRMDADRIDRKKQSRLRPNRNRREGEFRLDVETDGKGAVFRKDRRVPRITSYNVCYTKLLRVDHRPGVVRVSPHFYNNEDDIDGFVESLTEVVRAP